MRLNFKIVCVWLLLVTGSEAYCQQTKAATTKKDTATKPVIQSTPKSTGVQKTEAAVKDAERYAASAKQSKALLNSIVPLKTRDTVYIVIAGIKYSDPSLALLKKRMDEVKGTSGLVSTYRNGMAVIKILYKGGNASGLYDLVGNDVKELFLVEEMEGPRMVLNYINASFATPSKQ